MWEIIIINLVYLVLWDLIGRFWPDWKRYNFLVPRTWFQEGLPASKPKSWIRLTHHRVYTLTLEGYPDPEYLGEIRLAGAREANRLGSEVRVVWIDPDTKHVVQEMGWVPYTQER